MARKQVLIIGLDGATLDLIRPWAKEGHLPNLARLMEEGAWGPLHSTIPPNSCPAWTSCTTGVNPGKHGVTSFFERREKSYLLRPVSARSVRTPRVWDLLGERGHTVGILNVPVTYPPRPVNGYMIAGMLAPTLERAVWPPELCRELLSWVPDYRVEAPVLDNPQRYLNDIGRSIDRRCRAALALSKHRPTDFRMVVFTETDRLQHFFWAAMDETHPLHNPMSGQGVEGAIAEGYRLLDEAVGRLVEAAGDETTVLIVSDHGFQPVTRTLFVNAWLEHEGYLFRRRPSGRAQALQKVRRWAVHLGVDRLLRRAKWALAGTREIKAENLAYADGIDWSRTRAALGPNLGINVNLKGRDPLGLVEPGREHETLLEEIREGLLALRDPLFDRPVLQAVLRPEEVYWGEHLDRAPDLLLVPVQEPQEGRVYAYSPRLTWPDILALPDRITGNHAPAGTFIAWGPEIVPGQVQGLHIWDVSALVLPFFDQPIPAWMDGRPLQEATQTRTAPAGQEPTGQPEEPAWSEEEESIVEDRLRALGYLE